MDGNGYCPACASSKLERMTTNTPAVDFKCPSCDEVFQLKSAKSPFGNKVVDGAYSSMLQAINSDSVPNLLLMQYKLEEGVIGLEAIPAPFLVPSTIERRNPLGPNARRAGWIGCNILLGQIPAFGRIAIIKNAAWLPRNAVVEAFGVSRGLRSQTLGSRTWLLAVARVIEELPSRFDLAMVYSFEDRLQAMFPSNRHVRAKIRQQLQVLRNLGRIKFEGSGVYRKSA